MPKRSYSSAFATNKNAASYNYCRLPSIYKAIEEIKAAMEGMLSPDIEEKISYNVPFYKRHSNICYIWPSSVKWGNVKNTGVQFGFNKGLDYNQYGLSCGRLDFFKSQYGITIRYNDEHRNVIDISIQYVHQLQNLYFALTGKELEISK